MAVVAMATDLRSSIRRNYDLLVRSIDPTEELLERLWIMDAFGEHIGQIKTKSTPNERNGLLLRILLDMQPRVLSEITDELLEVLRSHDQEHVVNLLTGRSGRQPMSQAHLEKLNRYADRLVEVIDPFGGLVLKLLSLGVFTKADCNRVSSKNTCNGKVEEILNVIERKSDCAYDKFESALKTTGQSHVVYILTDGQDCEQLPPLCDADLRALNVNRSTLKSHMEPEYSGLLDKLIENGTFSSFDKQRVEAAENTTKKNGVILDIMSRKSQNDFNNFIIALKESEQQHVVSKVFKPKTGKTLTFELRTEESVKLTSDDHGKADTANDTIEDDISHRIVVNSSEIANELVGDGGEFELVRNCIKLRFHNLTLESLRRLKQLLETGRLREILTKLCNPELTKYRLTLIILPPDEEEFDRVTRELLSLELMTSCHKKALLSMVDKLSNSLRVSENLFSHLSMCSRRKIAILSQKSGSERVKLLLEITSRRPDLAFNELCNALEATEQDEAAELLQAAAAAAAAREEAALDTCVWKGDSEKQDNEESCNKEMDRKTKYSVLGISDSLIGRSESVIRSENTAEQHSG